MYYDVGLYYTECKKTNVSFIVIFIYFSSRIKYIIMAYDVQIKSLQLKSFFTKSCGVFFY